MPSEPHAERMTEIVECSHFPEPQEPQRFGKGRPSFKSARHKRTSKPFTRPCRKGQIKIASASLGNIGKSGKFRFVGGTVIVLADPAAIMDTPQNYQGAHLV